MSTENHENEIQPTRNQFSTARDAVALARTVLSDDQEGTHALIQQLLNDPEAIPGVLYGLCGMISQALPPETSAEVFFRCVSQLLDDAETGLS